MHKVMVGAGLSAVLLASGGLWAANAVAGKPAASGDRTVELVGSVAPVFSHHPGLGAVPDSQRETIEVWLAGRTTAAQSFVDAVDTPGSSSYGDYLSPAAYAARFGPRPAQVRAVRSFLVHAGFSAVGASADDGYVSATAPVMTINRAFSVQMRRYRVGAGQNTSAIVDSNNRALSLPASIGSDVLAVSGLNSAAPILTGDSAARTSTATTPHATDATDATPACSKGYWAQKTMTITPAYGGLTQAAIPECGYSARQIRGAYGITAADTGAGKTVAVIQVGAPSQTPQAVIHYAKAEGLPAPAPGQLRTDTVGGHADCSVYDDTEAYLDSEALYAMAPRANQLISNGCYTGNNVDQALLDAEMAPLTGHRTAQSPTIESSSYYFGAEGQVPRSILAANHAIALRAAAEGVSLVFLAGDSAGLISPSDDPDTTAVGGTVLGIGSRGQRLFETGAWESYGERLGTSEPWTNAGNYGTGGGASTVYGEPSYQRAVVPHDLAENSKGQLGRTTPDLSADADAESGLDVYDIYPQAHGRALSAWVSEDGTSLSTPLVAGIVADAEQTTHRGLGLLNPLLYSLAGTAAFHDLVPLPASAPQTDRLSYMTGPVEVDHKYGSGERALLNVAQGVYGDHQLTAPGYDTMTGLGSPNGPAFIAALRHAAARRPRRSGSASPTALRLEAEAAPRSASSARTPGARVSGLRSIQVWLAPKMTAAERFATAVSTPDNPMYRRFLTPDAYTAEFGPSAQTAEALSAWLRSRGFRDVGADVQRDYITASLPAGQAGRAVRAAMARTTAAPATATGVRGDAGLSALRPPASLAHDILGIIGLGGGAPSVSMDAQTASEHAGDAGTANNGEGPCSHYWGQHMVSGLPPRFGTTTFPTLSCPYTASQYRSVYGFDSTDAGTGQTIAFAEPGGLVPGMFATLVQFARRNHLPAPAASRFMQINQQPASCHKLEESFGEEQMDVEAAYAMAPGATQLVVGGNPCDRSDGGYGGGFATDTAIIDGNGTQPLASVVSDSWETGFNDQAAYLDNIETAYLVKAAAVGVGMYYASGDQACATQPSDNPWATGVAPTTLGITKSGKRLFETGNGIGFAYPKHATWKPDNYFGYGGGLSLDYSQPGYQKGVVPRDMSVAPRHGLPPGELGCKDGGPAPHPGAEAMRSAPDLSAGDGMAVGVIRSGHYTVIDDGGSSLSSPLIAGMVAAAQQGQATPYGFINPALYRLAGTSAFYEPRPITDLSPTSWRASVCVESIPVCDGTSLWLTDDQSSTLKDYSGQVTVRGYNDTTGLGVPDGRAFIDALRRLH